MRSAKVSTARAVISAARSRRWRVRRCVGGAERHRAARPPEDAEGDGLRGSEPIQQGPTIPMAKPNYQRVIVKLSGEALSGPEKFGIHQPTIERFAADLV